MKKVVLLLTVLFSMIYSSVSFGAEMSNDKMSLEWNTSKVWVNGGQLCVTGTFTNKRSDYTITKLNEFIMRVIYTDKDGQRKEFTGQPTKLPLCKIPAKGSRKVSFNFGPFDGEVNNWVTAQTYTFSYIDGARF